MTNVVPISKPTKRAYSNWLDGYIQHQRYSESPLNFHLWTGIFTIAATLQRKVWIDELHFQWTPNMYIILVGPPGVAAKSTTMRQGLSLLERVEGVKFGPQSLTWQALLEAFSEASTSVKIPGLENPQPMSCLSIGIGELGTFFDPSNKELTDQLTALWDGQLETARRRTRKDGETLIRNPWLNIIACTTPAWLRERFPKVAIGGGLTSRIVFVYGEKKRLRIPYPSQLNVDELYHKEEDYLVHDLQRISLLAGQYSLEAPALAYGAKLYDRILDGNSGSALGSGRFDGYVARKQSHIHKLAIILAAAQRDELIITEEDLKKAERYVNLIEPDMAKVFESIGVHESAQNLGEIETYIKNLKKIDSKTLWLEFRKTMDAWQYQNAIKSALEAGVIKKEPDPNQPGNWIISWLGPPKRKEKDEASKA